MNRLTFLGIKAQCIKFAADEGLAIVAIDDSTFKAEASDAVVEVPMRFLYEKYTHGWTIVEVLANEMNYKESL